MPNRLAREESPYLRQHAGNPVDWYPWGPEALEKSRREDRPIFLSIGYAACHWCHVMAEESFENPEIAAEINRAFVPVKVDREERPELDRIYQTICMLVRGQGGWPLTCVLTPDLRPFHVGTYFPPEDRYGRPGLRRVAAVLTEAWQDRRDEVERLAQDWAEAIRQSEEPPSGRAFDLPERPLGVYASALRRVSDRAAGGFGGAPKFPPHQHLDLLLRHFFESRDPASLDMVLGTLRAMARGGVRDQLGGGFHRYSVDRMWRVPHFEKMLYDNALLAPIYADAAALTGDPELQAVALEVLADLDRTFSLPDGGFISSLDADSDGGEGRYYTFTPEEIRAAAPDMAPLLWRHYGVGGEAGSVEGRHVLRCAADAQELAAELGRDAEGVRADLRRGRAALLGARARRAPPPADRKVIAGWNGLAVSAFARVGMRLGRPELVRRAKAAAEFLRTSLETADGRLQRRWHEGAAGIEGYLEDYAFVALGLLDLHQATQDAALIDAALAIAHRALALFWDADAGSLRQTAAGAQHLIARPLDEVDSATPAGQSVMLCVLLRLLPLRREPRFAEVAEAILARRGTALQEGQLGYSSLAVAADLLGQGPVELALLGLDGAAAKRWLGAVQRAYHPGLVALVADDGDPAVPLLEGRIALEGGPTAYVCRGRACSLPIRNLPELLRELRLSPPSRNEKA